ncbi:hypothetical protein [Pseudoalteromonas luteoviolacea]|uniref:Uncharacterized protein n=1 Tax=Pseudoalteromonas luteoviolacea S4060-1 TaxID=1365257 RepID=A0A167LR99_9GAMM|nr:hypothetical protein [Pseudoalteromonas luteoviolacea]KZN65059.1 hypothetical protein N478_03355 [Pseudoalteromonas luteoviolacea S4060-1]
MKIHTHLSTSLLIAFSISLAGCGGSDDKVNVDVDKAPITKPDPKPTPPNPGEKEANHSVKKSKLGGSRVQKSTSGAHDLAATVTVINNKASSENFSLSNAAAN